MRKWQMAKHELKRPLREPDHMSKRGVPYWWAPEWVRGTSSDSNWANGVCPGYGRIRAIKEHGTVNLYMESKEGGMNYIKGSIKQEFKSWHEDRKIDYMI